MIGMFKTRCQTGHSARHCVLTRSTKCQTAGQSAWHFVPLYYAKSIENVFQAIMAPIKVLPFIIISNIIITPIFLPL